MTEGQKNDLTRTYSLFQWMVAELYPVPEDKPRTLAELAERVVREVKDLRRRTSPGDDVDALAQMRVELARLRQQVDGLTEANAELGLLLKRNNDAQHTVAEHTIGVLRKFVVGGRVAGCIKNEDTGCLGLIVDRLEDKKSVRYYAWLYCWSSGQEQCGASVQVTIERATDA